MQRSSSEQLILMCEECGEKLIILGPEEDWRSRCAVCVCECRHKLTPYARTYDDILAAS